MVYILFNLEFGPAYHNDYHGADVLQTTHCLLIKSNLLNNRILFYIFLNIIKRFQLILFLENFKLFYFFNDLINIIK